MKMRLRHRFTRFPGFVAALAAMCAIALPATAQDKYPSRTVRIIVGYSAGTTSDVFARIIANRLGEKWNQSVIVENREGAAGAIGSDAVAKANPDGYTLLLNSNALTLLPLLRSKVPFDPFKDLAPIIQVAQTPNILLVGKELGVANLREYIALAKKGQLQYASSGRGTPSHITVELFKSMAGIKVEEIPYKSSAQALTDTMSGQVSLNAPGIAQGLPHVKSGRMVALGITGSKRAPGAPDIPTLAEAGVPGYEAYGWHGIFAPAATPPEVMAFLSRELTEILTAPEMREKFAAQGAEIVASKPSEFAAFLRVDFAKWEKLFKDLGIKPE
jgi:tripartite-type tricarboxylate transporter receptor subunit TctC